LLDPGFKWQDMTFSDKNRVTSRNPCYFLSKKSVLNRGPCWLKPCYPGTLCSRYVFKSQRSWRNYEGWKRFFVGWNTYRTPVSLDSKPSGFFPAYQCMTAFNGTFFLLQIFQSMKAQLGNVDCRAVLLLVTLFLPTLGRISPLIVYHMATTGRNRVKSYVHQLLG
jgi:hypothetical protein